MVFEDLETSIYVITLGEEENLELKARPVATFNQFSVIMSTFSSLNAVVQNVLSMTNKLIE